MPSEAFSILARVVTAPMYAGMEVIFTSNRLLRVQLKTQAETGLTKMINSNKKRVTTPFSLVLEWICNTNRRGDKGQEQVRAIVARETW